MKAVDAELSRKITTLNDKNQKLTSRVEKYKNQNAELQKLLELAVASDARKESLLE